MLLQRKLAPNGIQRRQIVLGCKLTDILQRVVGVVVVVVYVEVLRHQLGDNSQIIDDDVSFFHELLILTSRGAFVENALDRRARSHGQNEVNAVVVVPGVARQTDRVVVILQVRTVHLADV